MRISSGAMAFRTNEKWKNLKGNEIITWRRGLNVGRNFARMGIERGESWNIKFILFPLSHIYLRYIILEMFILETGIVTALEHRA